MGQNFLNLNRGILTHAHLAQFPIELKFHSVTLETVKEKSK